MLNNNLSVRNGAAVTAPQNIAASNQLNNTNTDEALNRISEIRGLVINNNATDVDDATIYAGAGNDLINNNDSNDVTIFARRGDDVINNSDSDGTTIYAGKGDDVINNSDSDGTTIYAGRGDDVINNSDSDGTTIYAGRGNDVINTDTLGSNTIKAGQGDDIINVSVEMGSRTNPNGTLIIEGGTGHDKVLLSGKREDYDIDTEGAYLHRATGSRIQIKNDIEEINFQESSNTNIDSLETGLNDYFDLLATGTENLDPAEMANLTSRLDRMGEDLLQNTGPIKMSYDDFVGANEGAFSPVIMAAQVDFNQELNIDIMMDLENQMSEALSINTDAGRISAAALRTEMTITQQQLELNDGASELMNGLIGKVEIDFGDISQGQAENLYQTNLQNLAGEENRYAEALAVDTGRSSDKIAMIGEMRTTQHVVSELERQFGFNREDFMPDRAEQAEFIADLHGDEMLPDLENQMSEALSINTDAGRVSAAALRTEIAVTKKLEDFWNNRADYWNGDDSSTLNKVNVSDVGAERASQASFFVDFNRAMLPDLEAQLSVAQGLNTEAGRQSAQSLRNEISITRSLLEFWQSRVDYWEGS